MRTSYTAFIPSNRPGLANVAKKCFPEGRAVIFDGNGYGSFSQLVNNCIVTCPTERIIICNDKARPITSNIVKMRK